MSDENKPPVSKEDFERLWKRYEEKNLEWQKKQEELEAAKIERSKAVEAIADAIAPNTSFTRNGIPYTVVQRGDTHFFKTPKAKGPEF